MARRVTNRDAEACIQKREDFTNATRTENGRPGSFRGQSFYSTRGHLPEQYVLPSLEKAEYVVYSYDTPLAWYEDGQWYYASVAYSPTTSNHQHIVRFALRNEEQIGYVGGDWKGVPGAGKFWDGSPKINASTGAPAGYYGVA